MRRFLSYSIPLLGLLLGSGCDSGGDDKENPSPPPKPTLSLFGVGTCGNAKGPTHSDVTDLSHPIELLIKGIDSATSSGIFKPNTEVKLTQSGDGAVIFESALEDDPTADEITLVLAGRSIKDNVYCVSAGSLTLKASVQSYEFEEASIDLEAEVAIDCLSPEAFLDECDEAQPVDMGVPDADAGPMPEEACQGDLDQRAIADLDVLAKAIACGQGCAEGEAIETCAGACVADETRISDDCATCYGHLVACTLTECADECAADPTAEECATCQADEGCAEAFFDCSGETALTPGEDIDMGPPAPDNFCSNEGDSTIISSTASLVIHKALACGEACVTEGVEADAAGACMRECMGDTEGLALSGDCLGCYSDLMICALPECAEECTNGFNSRCETCQQATPCAAEFFHCSGNDKLNPPGTPPPRSWSISFVPQENMIIGIRGTGAGRQDNVALSFNVNELSQGGQESEPIDGVEVKFFMPDNPPPGIKIDPASDISEGGVVRTRVIAGGTPGVLSIEARACRYGFVSGENSDTECRPPLDWDAELDVWACDANHSNACPETARSGTVVIRGGVPSMRAFDFWCEHPIIPAFSSRPLVDNWLIVNGEQTDCGVLLGDRVNGTVDTATQVFFLTEAGTITQSGETDDEGVATTNHRTGLPAPVNIPVEARHTEIVRCTEDLGLRGPTPRACEAGDPEEGHLGCCADVERPIERDLDQGLYVDDKNFRDGLVTLVAVTRGEEDFIDSNGDKIFEEGVDIFTPEHDLTPPYIDANDNRRYDQYCNFEFGGPEGCDDPGRFYNEEFRRTTEEQEFPEPYGMNDDDMFFYGNGEWDADIEIWKTTKVLWVGDMTDYSIDEASRKSYIIIQSEGGLGQVGGPCEGMHYSSTGDDITIIANFVDDNGNCLGGYGEGDVDFDEDGDFVLISGITQTPIADNYCTTFNPNTGEIIPSSSPFRWVIRDTDDLYQPVEGFPPYPHFKEHTIRLRYRSAGGEDVTFEHIIRTCRYGNRPQ